MTIRDDCRTSTEAVLLISHVTLQLSARRTVCLADRAMSQHTDDPFVHRRRNATAYEPTCRSLKQQGRKATSLQRRRGLERNKVPLAHRSNDGSPVSAHQQPCSANRRDRTDFAARGNLGKCS